MLLTDLRCLLGVAFLLVLVASCVLRVVCCGVYLDYCFLLVVCRPLLVRCLFVVAGGVICCVVFVLGVYCGLLLVVWCLMCVVCCALCVVDCSLFVVRCLGARCWLFVVCCGVLIVARFCCALTDVRWSLRVVCRLFLLCVGR